MHNRRRRGLASILAILSLILGMTGVVPTQAGAYTDHDIFAGVATGGGDNHGDPDGVRAHFIIPNRAPESEQCTDSPGHGVIQFWVGMGGGFWTAHDGAFVQAGFSYDDGGNVGAWLEPWPKSYAGNDAPGVDIPWGGGPNGVLNQQNNLLVKSGDEIAVKLQWTHAGGGLYFRISDTTRDEEYVTHWTGNDLAYLNDETTHPNREISNVHDDLYDENYGSYEVEAEHWPEAPGDPQYPWSGDYRIVKFNNPMGVYQIAWMHSNGNGIGDDGTPTADIAYNPARYHSETSDDTEVDEMYADQDKYGGSLISTGIPNGPGDAMYFNFEHCDHDAN